MSFQQLSESEFDECKKKNVAPETLSDKNCECVVCIQESSPDIYKPFVSFHMPCKGISKTINLSLLHIQFFP